MQARPASTPPPDAITDGLFGGEVGLLGEVVEVDDDGDGVANGVPTSNLLSSCAPSHCKDTACSFRK